MKAKTLLILMILLALNSKAQNFQWSTYGGSNWYDFSDLSMDTSGNFYLSGVVGEAALLSNSYFYFENDSVRIAGVCDIFTAKLNSSGDFQWVVTCGSSINNSLNEGGRLNYNKSTNSIYLNGDFTDNNARFGNYYFPLGPHDFIAKLDLNGAFNWVKLDVSAVSKDFDKNGFVYLVGYYPNFSQNHLMKIDTLGNIIWSKSIVTNSGPRRVYFYNDSLCITGQGKINFQLDTANVTAQDSFVYFISIFDTAGSVQRYFTIESPNPMGEYASGISNNSIVNVLYYTDTIKFNTTTYTAPGSAIIISKHDLNGQFKWAKRIDNTGFMTVESISYTPGSIYLTGWYEDHFLFDSTYAFTDGLSFIGRCFVIKLDEDGNYKGSFTLPKSKGTGIIKVPDGGVVLVGTFRDTLQLGSKTLVSNGYDDIFIAKMDSLTSIPETYKTKQEELLIYANPNTGNCRVVLPDDIHTTDNILLTISDISGRIIFQRKPQEMGNEIVVNLEQEANGKYFVQLTDGKKIYSGVIIFEK